jgi:hypothetical protein
MTNGVANVAPMSKWYWTSFGAIEADQDIIVLNIKLPLKRLFNSYTKRIAYFHA